MFDVFTLLYCVSSTRPVRNQARSTSTRTPESFTSSTISDTSSASYFRERATVSWPAVPAAVAMVGSIRATKTRPSSRQVTSRCRYSTSVPVVAAFPLQDLRPTVYGRLQFRRHKCTPALGMGRIPSRLLHPSRQRSREELAVVGLHRRGAIAIGTAIAPHQVERERPIELCCRCYC